MVLETKSTVKKETSSRAFRLHIPAEMVTDSAFPLVEGEVTVKIVGKTLVVETITNE